MLFIKMSKMTKQTTGEAEALEQWAILVLPWLPPSTLSAAASTCRSLRRVAAAVNSRRVADAARGLEIYPIPFHNPTSDPTPYSYFLYSRFPFSSPPPFCQSWGGNLSRPATNPFSLADFISSVTTVSFFSGCDCVNCSIDGGCPCSGFDDGGGIGVGSLRECGVHCSCGLECVNRTTQRGIGVRVKIVRDLKKGWGLHADQVLNRGEFICEYAGAITCVQTQGGLSKYFPISVGLHQGSALSLYLPALVMDVLTRHLPEDVPWCMLFADDIPFVDKIREGVKAKLEVWRSTLESKGFRLSRSKTEYMECNFSSNRPCGGIVTLGNQVINKSTRFRYLGSIVQSDGEIDGDIISRIQVGWLKWRNASGLLCDRKVPLKLEGKFYKMVVRPAMLYGAECWPLKEKHNTKLSVAEMRMLRWMSSFTLRDRIRNEHIREKVGVAPVEDKIRKFDFNSKRSICVNNISDCEIRALSEFVTTEEARRRLQTYDELAFTNKLSPALLVVREHLPSGKACLRVNIDATKIGNVARFINHSCDGGNLTVVLVRNSGSFLPRLCFFAAVDISEGEELTFSYGDTHLRPNGLPCFCGKEACMGVLPSEET
ncbi:hypothetical protein IEQ34_016211 [Dendrobium chrysotoxum]|uniref:Histone-lysine N-methyltransferase SUVR3 n=1 Tax=Dendrobium chrysotoxum TaxID=161865 RepID=A0AAV7GDP0_DENCH|nr:hypothetical protein IEQ34_016211 [Dendrobium chrysotoxum]